MNKQKPAKKVVQAKRAAMPTASNALFLKRSKAAKKAWSTRRANARKS